MPPLRLGIVGDTHAAAARRRSLARCGLEMNTLGDDPDLSGVDVLFVASPSALRHGHALAAVRQGVAVFAEWPPAPALSDVQALVAAASEAGVPVGTSRPLRFLPGLAAAVPSRLVVVRRTLPPGTPLLTAHTLADLADLCRHLTGSAALTRIDGWLASLWPDSPQARQQRKSIQALRAAPLRLDAPELGSTLAQLRRLQDS